MQSFIAAGDAAIDHSSDSSKNAEPVFELAEEDVEGLADELIDHHETVAKGTYTLWHGDSVA